ncbi:MAG: radical SAM family heme chaperone HemW [Lactobacillales bacterium]|jgi:oxygen-independent coproporphyrinogen-3 oxidase|nr:radical SAM family heme chaperone HemW [Lactobacillales bacterium]
MTSAYIHIPFCKHICYYCDFNKVFLEDQPVESYIDLLLREIELTMKSSKTQTIETIYIGGGTPTSLSAKQLERLLKGIRNLLTFVEGNEFTIEANPGDLTAKKLSIIKEYGINRISLGVQTFDDELLRKIGRRHTAKDVVQTLDILQSKDFKNISLDLIYALPDQTIKSLKETLKIALTFALPHYSLYSLILEDHTIFMNQVKADKLKLPNEDFAADMFKVAMDYMRKSGLKQYEIANFATFGFESKHNLKYWNNEHYYGFGAGAAGYIDNLRYKNHGPIQHYLASLKRFKLPLVERKKLSLQNQIEEEMFLGLRKMCGVSKQHFLEKFGISFEKIYGKVSRQLVEQGLLCDNGENIALSKQGVLIGNIVFEKFLLDF